MPFLRLGPERDTQGQSALGEENGVLWGGDAYQPSKASEQRIGLDGLGLPESLVQTQRRLCGNTECSSGWTAPWRSRRRPILKGDGGVAADAYWL